MTRKRLTGERERTSRVYPLLRTVSTVDLRVQLAEGFSSSYLPQLRPQVITHLRVKPGIDTVAISFRTTRPTIPVVESRESNGAFLEGRLPLLGGLQTRHTCVFGLDKPLAPNTKLNFRIEAFGPTLDPASLNKAVVTGEFMTGARIAEVFFESLDVLAYSDPGDGEFMFVFGVGNAETGALLDTTFWPDLGTTDIGEDDSAVPLNQRTSLLPSPVRLWLQVMGTESDYAMPWDSRSIGSGLPLQFKGVGRKYEESGIAQRSTVTVIVDIGEEPGRRMIPFDMDTGDSPTHFTVSGHIAVHAFEGELISTKMTKSAKRPRRLAYLDEPGSIAHLGGADGGAVQTVALGSDGAMHCLRSRNDYRLKADVGSIIEEFADLKIKFRFGEGVPNLEPRDDIKITDPDPIVRCVEGDPDEAVLVQRRWSWPGPNKRSVYNIRSEGREFTSNRMPDCH